jgi:hypothetical protein
VTIAKGTSLVIRLREAIDSSKQSEGDLFTATLDKPLIVDGFVIAEKGSNVRGKIASLKRAGKVSGDAAMSLQLTEINTTDGQRVNIRTTDYHAQAPSQAKGNAEKIGAVAAVGAIIGAIAGGGKGAAIGAGAGGAAGAGGVLATRNADVRLTSETRLTFQLAEALTLTEKIN